MSVHKQGCRGKAFCSCGGDDRVGIELNPADLREDLRKRRKPFDAAMAEQVIRHHVRFVAEGDAVYVLGLDDAGKAVASFAEEAATSAKAEEGGATALREAVAKALYNVSHAHLVSWEQAKSERTAWYRGALEHADAAILALTASAALTGAA